MFTSRRKKAIGLLTKRRSEIDEIQTMTGYERWRVRANAVVKQYIGDNEFHRQNFAKVDLKAMPSLKDEKRKTAWVRSQKILAKEYMNSCIDFLNNDGNMVYEPNWFCKRTVSELLSMIAIFQAILLGSVLPYTCNQGKIQGAVDSKDKIRKLEGERDSLRTVLINCISNLSKPDNNPKEKPIDNKN